MSEILNEFIIEPVQATIVVEPNNINVIPEAVNLNIYTTAAPVAGGPTTSVQFNELGLLQGSNTFTFDTANLTVNIDNLQIGNVANLGSPSNVKISGGNNAYFLQTDGAGNLTWAIGGANVTGNGVPGGANTQIQFNDGGANFGGATGFTFDYTSNIMNAPGNIVAVGKLTSNDAALGNSVSANYFVGNLTGTADLAITAQQVSQATQSNITAVGTLTNLNVAGNIITGNVTANYVTNNILFNSPGNVTITGTTTIQQAKEKVVTEGTGAVGTINFDVLTQSILFKTANATANFTLNVRGNSTTTLNSVMNNDESITICLINTNGAAAFYANVFKIDGTTITPLYVANATPTSGTSLGKDQYIYNIIKTAANTYTVLGSKIGFV